MELYIAYGAVALYIINTLIGLKIFARTEELNKLEASLIRYASERYLSKDMYNANHQALQEQIMQIHRDISDMKEMLFKALTDR